MLQTPPSGPMSCLYLRVVGRRHGSWKDVYMCNITIYKKKGQNTLKLLPMIVMYVVHNRECLNFKLVENIPNVTKMTILHLASPE